MTTAQQIVLDNLPGPDSKGINNATITAKCWRDGLDEPGSWRVLKQLVDLGFVARLSGNHGDGDRLFYKLTPKGKAALKAVAA